MSHEFTSPGRRGTLVGVVFPESDTTAATSGNYRTSGQGEGAICLPVGTVGENHRMLHERDGRFDLRVGWMLRILSDALFSRMQRSTTIVSFLYLVRQQGDVNKQS
jgi:hypothetical protein